MSGGSYDYAYSRIEDLASAIRNRSLATPARRAFAALLERVAAAAHDIEWADSGDYAQGDEEPAIRAALGDQAEALILAELLADARVVSVALDQQIRMATEALEKGESA